MFICRDEDVRTLIIKAAKETEKEICSFYGYDVNKVTVDMAIRENARNVVMLSFTQYFRDIEDNQELNTPEGAKAWLKKLFDLIVNSPARVVIHNLPLYFTEASQCHPLPKPKLGKCATFLHYFFHKVWCVKLALLPPSYSRYPTLKQLDPIATKEKKKKTYLSIPLGEHNAPQFLALARSSISEKPYDSDVNALIPDSAHTNISWYAHRVVRAQDVWDLNDLTSEHINDYLSLEGKKDLGFQRTTSWLSPIVTIHSNELGFDATIFNRKVNPKFKNHQTIIHLLTGDPDSWLTDDQIKANPENKAWVKKINKYVSELGDAGYTNAPKQRSLLIKNILEPLILNNECIPSPQAYSRKHWLITTKKRKEDLSSTSWGAAVRTCNNFFEWLVGETDDFKNPISRLIDIPKTRRSQGTTKKLLPEGTYQIVLTYNYAIAEFIKFVNYNLSSESRHKLVNYAISHDTIEPYKWGITPIYYVEGKPKEINEISTKLLSSIASAPPQTNNRGTSDHLILPNRTNIISILMETGIRLKHIQWLDEETYNKPSLPRNSITPRGYGINKIHVNTDKSHGAWDCVTCDAVLDTCENQAKFKSDFLLGDNEPTWYGRTENSPFGKVHPLFATVNGTRTYTKSFPITDQGNVSSYWKNLIRQVSFDLLKYESTSHFAAVDNPDDLELRSFLHQNRIKVEQTPHGCRSQVVSDRITMLPPNLIGELTGHVDEAHVIYYAQVKESQIKKHEEASAEQVIKQIAKATINTQGNSALKRGLVGDDLGAVIANFGAISFEYSNKEEQKTGGITRLLELNRKSNFSTQGISSALYFDTTHICPFNNQCPNDVLTTLKGDKPCGQCPYSVKTIDHIPAITSKIRKMADHLNELQSIISQCKERKEPQSNYSTISEERNNIAHEISAWSATLHILSSMTEQIKHKDKWLTEKPEFLEKHLSQFKASNELTLTLAKMADAENSATYMTPSLKAKMTKLRKTLLISTKNFEELLHEPDNYELLHEVKGIVSSVCALSGLSTTELGNEIMKLNNTSKPLLVDLKASK